MMARLSHFLSEAAQCHQLLTLALAIHSLLPCASFLLQDGHPRGQQGQVMSHIQAPDNLNLWLWQVTGGSKSSGKNVGWLAMTSQAFHPWDTTQGPGGGGWGSTRKGFSDPAACSWTHWPPILSRTHSISTQGLH